MWIIKDAQGNVLIDTAFEHKERKVYKVLVIESSYIQNQNTRVKYRLSYYKGDGVRIETQKEGTLVWLTTGPDYPSFTKEDVVKVIKLFRRAVRSFDSHVKFVRKYE